MKYCIIVKNSSGDNLRVFEQDEFDKAVRYMESTRAVLVSTYRIQLVEKGLDK